MKRAEIMALSNRGGMRSPFERATAWLLARLGENHGDAAGWVLARKIEAARSRSGVSRAALKKARRWLQQTGHIEKRRNGYQGPWMYRLAASASRPCPVCGAVNHVPAMVSVEPPQTPESTQPAVGIRYVGRCSKYEDRLYRTGLIWHGHGDIKLITDYDKAQRMARNHPDVYDLVEVEPD